ncbi:MAG TPA: M35 family metallo-endopeptidase [Albitalea sp.]|uniref:M35 family metallo-endopeptidase n=1 Tax=Piscinibacter sp. TaxID=1903157 RepID=UPI002ED3E65C
MVRSVRWMVAVLAFGAAAGLQAASRDGVDVQLSAPSPVLRGDVDVVVDVTVTNTARHPVTLLRWQLPSDELEGPLFRITRDDQLVRYLGPVIKRTQPDASDHVKLEPGATLSYQVELTGAYDLSQSGRYAIQYRSRGLHGNAATLDSTPLYLWLEGRSGKAAAPTAAPAAAAASIGYTGNCSASQQSTLQSAVSAATSYASGSSSYLGGTPRATQRYVKWFGAYSSAGWNTAKTHFAAIQDAFVTKPLTLDCKCKKRNIYAYVYPTQPYKIYLCGAFWSAPMTGTDSKGGTLIHEMSHFDVVAGTDDWAYGQSAAAALAVSDPAKALDNADSHEYFAENNPPLP